MKVAYRSSKICDAATEPKKLKQKTESLTIQILPEKNMQVHIYWKKKHDPPDSNHRS